MSASAPSLLALVGPTASGKTAAALALARQCNAEIISCDSLAVYRDCNIGTAKPSPTERLTIPHHLIDVVTPDQPFTAADYVTLADQAISAIRGRGKQVLVVGGTGLYLRALIEGLFPSPTPDPQLRAAMREEAARVGWPVLHARLAIIDPPAAARIAPGDRVRIERALEVYAQTGETMTLLQEKHRHASRYKTFTVVLDPGMTELETRITERVKNMLVAGLVDETRSIAARYGRTAKPLGALGYKEAMLFLDGKLNENELLGAIYASTRQLSRRQRTWFKRYHGEEGDHGCWILHPDELPLDRIQAFLGDKPWPPA